MGFKVNDRVFHKNLPKEIGIILEINYHHSFFTDRNDYIKIKLDNFYIPRFYLPEEISLYTNFYFYAI